jgi:hypothetical protein
VSLVAPGVLSSVAPRASFPRFGISFWVVTTRAPFVLVFRARFLPGDGIVFEPPGTAFLLVFKPPGTAFVLVTTGASFGMTIGVLFLLVPKRWSSCRFGAI